MRITALVCVGLLFAAHAPALADEAPGDNPVERALRSPPATGLLITFVGSGTQAQEAGIRPGDILVSYGGTQVASPEALAAAKEAAKAETALECVLMRGAERITCELVPGPIGVNVMAVVKGKPPAPLPPATELAIDLSPLKAKPREVWYAFSLDGRTKVGFEHGVLRLEDGVLRLRHEVAFDGGERWGLNHQVVTTAVRVRRGSFPVWEPESTRYENVTNGWIGLGARQPGAGDTSVWEVRWPPQQGEAVARKHGLPGDLPVVPSYLLEALASLMPRKPTACFHFRTLNEGMGTIDFPSALYVVGEEEIEQGGARTKAWKIELRKLGAVTGNTWWVSAEGRVLRIHYGQAWANATTKAKALKDLPEGIAPKPAAR